MPPGRVTVILTQSPRAEMTFGDTVIAAVGAGVVGSSVGSSVGGSVVGSSVGGSVVGWLVVGVGLAGDVGLGVGVAARAVLVASRQAAAPDINAVTIRYMIASEGTVRGAGEHVLSSHSTAGWRPGSGAKVAACPPIGPASA
ncbi:hypothetical protein GCM10009733_059700 [Nonomuraea maheshkhaliensis]|uniref:Uncharacterized protein n=1 Tax=Nonomuraea maheshkhaliensis TaxID=419590 RepID=A0ABP4RLG6_9ACTN